MDYGKTAIIKVIEQVDARWCFSFPPARGFVLSYYGNSQLGLTFGEINGDS